MLNVKHFRYLLTDQVDKNIMKIFAFIFLNDLMFIKQNHVQSLKNVTNIANVTLHSFFCVIQL